MKNKKLFPLALMAPFAGLWILSLLGYFFNAYAAEEVPALGASIMALFTAIQSKAVTAVVIMHVFTILRTNEALGILGKLGLSGKGMRVAVAVLTTLGYVANAWATSGDLGAAAIEGLFTAGGAMLIFDAFKSTAAAAPAPVVAALAKKKANLA